METAVSVGNRVSTANGTGVVRFAGTTAFQAGKWIGVELDGPTGKNNGTVQGKAYFSCRDGYGVFVRPTGIKIIDVSARKSLDEQTRGVSKVIVLSRLLAKLDCTYCKAITTVTVCSGCNRQTTRHHVKGYLSLQNSRPSRLKVISPIIRSGSNPSS